MAGSFTDLRIWQKAHELTLKIYIKFLIDARASVLEAQSELMVARDVGYCNKNQANTLIDEYSELAKQINGFISYKRTAKTKI